MSFDDSPNRRPADLLTRPILMGPAITSLALMRVPAILEKHSIAPLDFFSRAGLSPNLFLQGARWMPRDYCFDLIQKAVQLTGNPNLGAQVGAAIQLPDLGTYGETIMAAPTLGEALRLAMRNLYQVNLGSILQAEISSSSVVLHFRFEGQLGLDPLQFDLGTIAVLRTVGSLPGEPDGIKVQLTLPSFGLSSPLDEHLGENIEFSSPSNAIIIDRELLNLPLVGNHGQRLVPDIAYISRTAQLIPELLPEGQATLNDIAARLDLKARTLQRKLAKFGITFEQLVDTTRRDEAMRLLKLNRDTLADIALQLGYSDQANFNRAFRRWTGNPPTAYRRSAA